MSALFQVFLSRAQRIMSDSGSDKETAAPTRKRKRVKRPEKWAQNVAKQLRNRGQAYTSVFTKKQVSARTIGKPCKDGCFDKVKRRVIEILFKEFWEIGNFDLQNAYIQKLVRPKEIKRRRKPKNPNAPGPIRSCSYEYTVIYSNTTYQVCKQGFLSIFGLKKARVETAMRKVTTTSAPTTDQRGKHNKRRMIVGVMAELVREHIKSIPIVSSHYNRRYLDSSLNVNKLYGMYCQWMSTDHPDESKVKESYYRHIFNTEFSLFFQPTKADNRDHHHYNNNDHHHSGQSTDNLQNTDQCQAPIIKDYVRPLAIAPSPIPTHHPQYYLV